MGQLIWTLGIIVLALKINHDEAKAHQSAPNVIQADSVRVDSTGITIHGDTIRVRR
jgi:hypothetical protein